MSIELNKNNKANSKKEKRYGVSCIKTSIIIHVLGKETKLDLNFAEGMVGALPVFDTKENAKKYANGIDIFTITI